VQRVVEIIYNHSSAVIVNREGLRLLCMIAMCNNNTSLWCKFESESKKAQIDYSNCNDIIEKYKEPNLKYLHTFYSKFKYHFISRIMFTPYKIVQSFDEGDHKEGVIFFGEHVLFLPKTLHLPECYTISFRFFNPPPSTINFKTLLQDSNGISILCIHPDKQSLGSFSVKGEWIDSGCDLFQDKIYKEWVHVALSNRLMEDGKYNLNYYLNGELKNTYTGSEYQLPSTVKYIGNSKNYFEPFGIFCDLKIINEFHEKEYIKFLANPIMRFRILYFFDHLTVQKIINNFFNNEDNTEETIFFSLKLVNCLLSERIYRKSIFMGPEQILSLDSHRTFQSTDFIQKMMDLVRLSKRSDIRKEIVKYFETIS
jgi:hypothetical protein